MRRKSVAAVLLVVFITMIPVVVVASGKANAADEGLPSLEAVYDGYIAALGGREAIEKLTTRVCTGQLIHDLPSREPPVYEAQPFEIYSVASGYWRLTVTGSEGIEQTGFDGVTGWEQNFNGVKPDQRMVTSRLGWYVNPQGPIQMAEFFAGMVLKRTGTIDGRPVYVVEPTSWDKERGTLYFDIDTGLLIRIGYHWYVQDYREIDGVKFPHKLIRGRKGGSSTYVFDEVKHNVPVEDALFAMPVLEVETSDVFGGIDDPKVLPLLKDLPYTHGGMNIPPRDGRLLHDLIIKNGYKRGLEIGTSNGYSTLWIGLAFRESGGKIITLEIEPLRAKEAQENFRKAGLAGVIDSRINDAFDEISKIEGEFDFVFLDAWKPDYIKFFELLKDRIPPGGAFAAHNVTSQARSMRDFLDAIESDPDFETTIHQTSTEGVSVSIKRR